MNDIEAGPSVHEDLLGSPQFRRTASDEEFESALESALESRAVVDLAVGITMGRHACDRETALATLLRTSRSFDISIIELARALVSNTGR